MKKTPYFPHFFNARNDQKILMIRGKFGLEGYAIFFMILETLAEENDGKIYRGAIGGLSLSYNYEKERLEEFIDFCLEIGLFYEKNGEIRSRLMDTHINMRKAFSEAGKLGAEKRWNAEKRKQIKKHEKTLKKLEISTKKNPNQIKLNKIKEINKEKIDKKEKIISKDLEVKNEKKIEEKKVKTPKEITTSFFDGIENKNNIYFSILKWLIEKNNIDQETAKETLNSFYFYWTEKNHSGKKERWELEKTFNVQRRLIKWLTNGKKWGTFEKIETL